MSNKDKLLKKIRNNPRDVRFSDLCKLLEWEGWRCKSTRTSSSHHTYKKKDFGRLTIVKSKHDMVKPEYVKKVLERMGA